MTRLLIIPSSITRWLRLPGFLRFIIYHLSFSVALLLTACDLGRHERMHDELLRARKMNKEYVDFTTDSVMKEVAAYYDRHGTPNERMEAHYLLGCTYRDMGEAPRAIDCYLDAAACADTTAADCDFYTLASIHAQMAWLYHQQLLFSYEIEAHRKASHYNYLAKDTLHALYEQEMVGSVYILQNKKDSAEQVIRIVMQRYRELGYIQKELGASMKLINILVEQPSNQFETKQLISRFDSLSESFDNHHELLPSKRIFYSYKGKFFENENLMDSAEYYYRKVFRVGMTYSNYDPMYKGLLNVYKKKSIADSIAKYAQLYCAVNDSSIVIKDQKLTAQLAASYNYSRYQKQALANEKKASKAREALIGVILLSCVIIATAYLLWRRYKRAQQRKHDQLIRIKERKQQEIERLQSEFSALTDQYDKNKQAMLMLEDSYKMAVASVQHKLENAQDVISELNEKYENSIAVFKSESYTLKKKLDELKSQKSIPELMDNAACFANAPIVIRVQELAEKQKSRILKKDWEELSSAIATYYPDLVKDINGINNVTRQDIQTAFLVILNIRTDDIARLLRVSGQRITNIKSELNLAMFGTKSARPLFDNMKSRYGIYLLDQ